MNEWPAAAAVVAATADPHVAAAAAATAAASATGVRPERHLRPDVYAASTALLPHRRWWCWEWAGERSRGGAALQTT